MNFAECLAVVADHTQRAPVDVYAIAREVGVPIVPQDLDDNISGAIVCADGDENYRIIVNANHATTRKRFTVAHELGHFIYHRDLLGRGTGDTRAYRSENTAFPNAHITPVEERQANTFAANTLMPPKLIRDFITRGVKDPELLAKIFQVSRRAMEIRLGRG